MRLNENTKIIGKKVILVPYEAKHVAKYHTWMQSTDLRELTASEPLSLDEEYAMQRSWREDEDKCTFLVLDREKYESQNDELLALVGDTNLFLRSSNDDGGGDENAEIFVAEAEIMIAEEKERCKGFGSEAMLLMFKYGTLHLNIKQFEVKIGTKNFQSLRMFEKFQFSETSRSEVFQEVTLQRIVDKNWLQWLDSQVQLNLKDYYQMNP